MMQEDEFERVHWPKLQEAVDMVMLNPPASVSSAGGSEGCGSVSTSGATLRISFEQMYSSVYKCVCRQQSEVLYQKLMEHVASNLLQWRSQVDRLLRDHCHPSIELVVEFDRLTNQYFQALSSIVPIFTYLNRFYVATKLETDIEVELLKLYGSAVADSVVQPVIRSVAHAKQVPFSISPAVVNSVLNNLHKINPSYSQLDPDLFSAHLSEIRVPMTESDLEAQRIADQQLVRSLRQSGFESNPSRKRCINDLYVGSADSS